MKDSPWEGGVRGVAAIWSPLIEKSKRVSNQMMFVSDWLPTLLSAAGVDGRQLGHIDGFDLWPALVSDKISSRSEILINIDDLGNYAAIRRGDFKYVIGETETGSAWVGASGHPSEGVTPEYDPNKVLHSKTGVAIAGVITTRQAMELNDRRKRNIRNVNDPALRTNFREKILNADNILQLRQRAQIKCNVKQEDKVPCNPMKTPCLFNIDKDPCEMVNLAERRPVILAILERILIKYRVTIVPPSNLDGDPRADPSLWNNTWTSWNDPNPLALSYTNTNEFQSYSGSAVAVMSIIVGLFIVGVITLLALKCGKSVSSNMDNFDYQNNHKSIVYTTNGNEETLPMSNIAESIKQNGMLKPEEIN